MISSANDEVWQIGQSEKSSVMFCHLKLFLEKLLKSCKQGITISSMKRFWFWSCYCENKHSFQGKPICFPKKNQRITIRGISNVLYTFVENWKFVYTLTYIDELRFFDCARLCWGTYERALETSCASFFGLICSIRALQTCSIFSTVVTT